MKNKVLEDKYHFLKDVTNLKKTDRLKYLKKKISVKNLHTIGEAIHNIKCCPTPKNKKICQLLKQLKKELKNLGNPSFDVEKKRQILSSQSGDGIFSIIAGTVLPFLLSLIKKK